MTCEFCLDETSISREADDRIGRMSDELATIVPIKLRQHADRSAPLPLIVIMTKRLC